MASSVSPASELKPDRTRDHSIERIAETSDGTEQRRKSEPTKRYGNTTTNARGKRNPSDAVGRAAVAHDEPADRRQKPLAELEKMQRQQHAAAIAFSPCTAQATARHHANREHQQRAQDDCPRQDTNRHITHAASTPAEASNRPDGMAYSANAADRSIGTCADKLPAD